MPGTAAVGTPMSGLKGEFLMTGHNIRVAAWQLNLSRDIHDTTGFLATADWRTKVSGLKTGKGSFSGFLLAHVSSSAAAADFTATGDADGVTTTLTVDNTTSKLVTYGGTSILSNCLIGQSVNGVATISGDFEFTGTVTETVATT